MIFDYPQAVAFLYSRPACQADAVQFAIAFAYYGLLRVPPNSKASQIDYGELEKQWWFNGR